jgi:hypothetical protein
MYRAAGSRARQQPAAAFAAGSSLLASTPNERIFDAALPLQDGAACSLTPARTSPRPRQP